MLLQTLRVQARKKMLRNSKLKIFLSFLLLVCFSSHISSQTTDFKGSLNKAQLAQWGLGQSSSSNLTLSFRSIKSIEDGAFSDLANLVWIDLSFNNLRNVDNLPFKGLPKLENLILESNQIEALPTRLFNGLRSLQTLYLYNNSIYTIKAGTFR